MVREYLEQNVFEALQSRLKFLFEEFDNIYVSFSGGKDSGLLLNLVLDYRRKYYPEKTLGVFHQDFEAQYTVTTEYVERTFERIKDEVEPYWVCLPMATRTALSSYEMYWYPWDDTKKDSWVRPMPQKEYVINLDNNPMTTYTIGCTRKTWQSSLEDGTSCPMERRKPSVCWESVRMSLSRGTAAF